MSALQEIPIFVHLYYFIAANLVLDLAIEDDGLPEQHSEIILIRE